MTLAVDELTWSPFAPENPGGPCVWKQKTMGLDKAWVYNTSTHKEIEVFFGFLLRCRSFITQ